MSGSKGRKRPRRTVTAVRSYAVPGSDDEAIADGDDMGKHRKPAETSLQKWIYHLGELAKEENRKVRISVFAFTLNAQTDWRQYKDEKKKIEMGSEPGTKVRVNKVRRYSIQRVAVRFLRRRLTNLPAE